MRTQIRIRIQHFTLLRIHIPLPKIMQIHAEPDPQPCLFQCAFVENNPNSYAVCFLCVDNCPVLSVLCRGEEDYPAALERGCRALSALAHHSHARRCACIFRVKKKNKLSRILAEIAIKIP
jgi:hypothetical protein